MTVQKHNDEFGWKRGQGAYSKPDPNFDPGKHKYDSFAVVNKKHDYLLDNERDQPAGKYLGGGGPVSKNERGGPAPARYKPKTGPIGIMQKPK